MNALALIFLTTTGLLPDPAAEPEASHLAVTTFTNDPPVIAATLESGPAGLRARLTVRFANPNQAQTGVEALYFDRPGDRGAALRVVQIRQRINPQGDPDIFMPTERTLFVDLPRSEGLGAVAVLNVALPFQDVGGPPRVRTLEVANAGAARDVGDADTVAAAPLGAGRRYPPLRNIATTREVVGATARLAVEFDVEVTDPNLKVEDVTAEIREQNLGDDPPTVADWLFVSVPAGAVGQGARRSVHVRVATRVPANPQRTMIIANPVSDRAPADSGSFQTIPIR